MRRYFSRITRHSCRAANTQNLVYCIPIFRSYRWYGKYVLAWQYIREIRVHVATDLLRLAWTVWLDDFLFGSCGCTSQKSPSQTVRAGLNKTGEGTSEYIQQVPRSCGTKFSINYYNAGTMVPACKNLKSDQPYKPRALSQIDMYYTIYRQHKIQNTMFTDTRDQEAPPVSGSAVLN